MAIEIDGTGSITGISAGGLPDGTVDTDVLAANAVTEAKLGSDEQKGLAKAWVNFDGTGTPAARESFNISSITDNATGNYTLNFTNAMSSANFAYTFAVGDGDHSTNGRVLNFMSSSTTALQILAEAANGDNQDESHISVVIFGA